MKQRIELIRPSLEEAASQAKQLGLPNEKVIELFKKILEDNDGK